MTQERSKRALFCSVRRRRGLDKAECSSVQQLRVCTLCGQVVPGPMRVMLAVERGGGRSRRGRSSQVLGPEPQAEPSLKGGRVINEARR